MPYDRDILVAEFLLTSTSRGPSAIAELLVPPVVLLSIWTNNQKTTSTSYLAESNCHTKQV